MAVGRNEHVVLNANAAPARQVNAGLDRDHHARRQRTILVDRQPRRFMHLPANAVPQRVAELRTVSRPFDHACARRHPLPS